MTAGAVPPPGSWVTAAGAGTAVLLAGMPVSAVVQGASWAGHAATAVALVVVVGLLLGRVAHGLGRTGGALVVVAGQLVAVLLLLTALFTDGGALGTVPGPQAFDEMATLIGGAGEQIASGFAPVAATAEILFLVTAAFGLLTSAAYLAAVCAGAPAAAGVPLLAAFAVPTALADELLPWWAMAGAAVGFGVLLVTAAGSRRQLPAGAAMTAGAIALALVVGASAGLVGTAGRFGGAGAGSGGSGNAIGLSPFTALRGQLDRATPTELFRVRGLPRPTYLRALTLRDYAPESGWQAVQPAPGVPLTDELTVPAGPGEQATVDVENVGFRDYWLPLYGAPLRVTGVAEGRWAYDRSSGTAYTTRPREEERWQQAALLPAPSAEQLRATDGVGVPSGSADTASADTRAVDAGYLDTDGVDPRVSALAARLTAGSNTDFDRAVALLDFFTGPGSEFRYSLRTAPGTGDDALVEFLTVGRAGYCEQFASAMAVMLRTAGVPARVAVGFTAGSENAEYRSVGTADAHAWVEAWFPGLGWTTFDPTPLTDGRSVVPPYVQQARGQALNGPDAAAPEQAGPGADTEQDPTAAQDLPEQLAPGVADPGTGSDAGLPVWPLAVIVVLGGLGAVPVAMRMLERRRRLTAVTAGGPGAAVAAWAELLADSADRGVPSPASDTVRGAARRLVREHRLDGAAQQALREIVGAVEQSWYSAGRPTPAELDDHVRAVRAGLATASPLGVRGTLLPRSVLDRRPRRNVSEPDEATASRGT